MPVPALITDLSTTIASNSPAGSETPADGDNYLRALSAFIAQLYAGTVNITLGDAAADTITVNAGIVTWANNPTHSGNHTFSGNVTVQGNSTLGNAVGDTLTLNGTAIATPNGVNFDSNTLVIDAANNRVGIGVASPSQALHLAGSAPLIRLQHNDAHIEFENTANTTRSGYLQIRAAAASVLMVEVNQPLTFGTNNAEHMQLDGSGNLLVSATGVPTGAADGIAIRAGNSNTKWSIGSTANVSQHLFYNPNGVVGSITTSGSATAYNTSSDARLKTAIAPLSDQGDVIDAIRVREFEFIAEPGKKVKGFVAQELVEVAPAAVSIGETWGVDFSKLMPVVVRELQSVRSRLAALES